MKNKRQIRGQCKTEQAKLDCVLLLMETENHNHLLSLGDISQEISKANISQEISNANTTSKPEPVFIFNLLLKPKAPYTSSIMKC